jgi:hypothetical protein
MFQRVNALLESEGNALVEKHEDVLVEAMSLVNDFQKTLKAFILNNPEEFIGENTEETYKNMRVFAEVGTSQFVAEVSNLYGGTIQEQTVTEDRGIAEYL